MIPVRHMDHFPPSASDRFSFTFGAHHQAVTLRAAALPLFIALAHDISHTVPCPGKLGFDLSCWWLVHVAPKRQCFLGVVPSDLIPSGELVPLQGGDRS
jgi:hypothetical protein